MVRPWLPGWARRGVAALVGAVSALARRAFTIVIAERYYARLFPGGVEVLNYARLEEYAGLQTIARQPPTHLRALYTGSVTDSRGARHHARLLGHLPADAEVLLIGQCAIPALRAELEAKAAADPRLVLVLAPGWVPRATIAARYAEHWTCGLAIFPDTPHYREKELTKFFEYMAAGLPVVCSDFPVWRELVVGNKVGLVVNPEDPTEAAAALLWLHQQPQQRSSGLGRVLSFTTRPTLFPTTRSRQTGKSEQTTGKPAAMYSKNLVVLSPVVRRVGEDGEAASPVFGVSRGNGVAWHPAWRECRTRRGSAAAFASSSALNAGMAHWPIRSTSASAGGCSAVWRDGVRRGFCDAAGIRARYASKAGARWPAARRTPPVSRN